MVKKAFMAAAGMAVYASVAANPALAADVGSAPEGGRAPVAAGSTSSVQDVPTYKEEMRISWQDKQFKGDDTIYQKSVALYLNGRVLAGLRAFPFSPSLTGPKLVQALMNSGAVMQDSADGRAAYEVTDLKTRKPVHLLHYKAGQFQDPAPNIPALQDFDRETHLATRIAYYHEGKLQDPPNGEPAWQALNRLSGQITLSRHFEAGHVGSWGTKQENYAIDLRHGRAAALPSLRAPL